MFKHTEESDKKIIDGYRLGIPTRVIAQDIGATKGVVIGRAARLGLSSMDNLVRAQSSDDYRNQCRENVLSRWAKATEDQRKEAGAAMAEGRTKYFDMMREKKALRTTEGKS